MCGGFAERIRVCRFRGSRRRGARLLAACGHFPADHAGKQKQNLPVSGTLPQIHGLLSQDVEGKKNQDQGQRRTTGENAYRDRGIHNNLLSFGTTLSIAKTKLNYNTSRAAFCLFYTLSPRCPAGKFWDFLPSGPGSFVFLHDA